MTDTEKLYLDGVIPFADEPQPREPIPNRYMLREDDKGAYLTCLEASNVAVRIERGFTVSAAAAHKYAEYTIFLDGAAQGEPFMDVKRKIYNLDHHEGCVRAFTLATCEQAMVMVLKGLDLAEGDWSVYGNDPDLDTVMAIWVLLNHVRLNEDDDLRARLMPLLRLQGVIDAHGLEMRELAGLPDTLMVEMEAEINALRKDEIDIKRAGAWGSTNFLEFTATVLHAIDEVLYSPQQFADLQDVEELVRFSVTKNRIGIVCRAEIGVYEVEEYLKKVHKDRLGLFLLQKDPSTYTTRLVDSFLPKALDSLHDRLNQMEPNLTLKQQWGGSSDIGGSPRGAGTALSPQQIARICQWVYRPPSIKARLLALAGAVGLIVLAVTAALLAAFRGIPTEPLLGTLASVDTQMQLVFSCSLFVVALLMLTPSLRKDRRGQVGLRLPGSLRWLLILPFTLVAAVALGGWSTASPPPDVIAWASMLVGVVAAEILFRGVAHDVILSQFRVVRPGGALFTSIPNVVSAILYTTVVVALFLPPNWQDQAWGGFSALLLMATAAFVMGLACGFARERSGSLLPPIALHAISVAAVWGGMLILS